MDEDLDEPELSDVDDGSDGSLSQSQDSDVDELDKEIDIVDEEEEGEESDIKKKKDAGPAFVNQNLDDDYEIEVDKTILKTKIIG